MSEAKDTAAAAMAKHGITVAAVFVPFSVSRSKGEKSPSLNWTVTLKKDGRDVVTTDYSAGCAHCPAYKLTMKQAGGQNSLMRDELIRKECETGKRVRVDVNDLVPYRSDENRIKPDATDVVYSLLMDSDVLDAGGFEEWASNYGYETDSRKAEAIYRACLEIALKVRAGLGESVMSDLRIAFEDY